MITYNSRKEIPDHFKDKKFLGSNRLYPIKKHTAIYITKFGNKHELFNLQYCVPKHWHWGSIPDHLKTKTALAKVGLKPTDTTTIKAVKVGGNNSVYMLYDIKDCIPKKKATAEQLSNLKKARKRKVELHTCPVCNQHYPKSKFKVGDMCGACSYMLYWKETSQKALLEMKTWLDHKNKYVILDVETTGLDSESEVIEISVINLDGEILLDTLVRCNGSITPEAQEAHGITAEKLKDAPSFYDVFNAGLKDIILSYTVLAYNSDFDIRIITQSLEINNIDMSIMEEVKHECIMEAYMKYNQSDRWISLRDASGECQSHRSLADCYLALEVIKSVASSS